VAASVKEDERGPSSRFCKSTASVRLVTPRCERTLLLRKCFFDSVFHFAAMDGKIKRRVCIKLGTTASETLEMLREAFVEHSLSQTPVFERH
jgi:hypothetical protein